MLQITPQMRILVALEAVDGRNYAPPNNMRSRTVPTCRNRLSASIGQRITRYRLGRSMASNLSGGRNRPRRKVGEDSAAIASSFSVGSARR
jgi:hypothetical protein